MRIVSDAAVVRVFLVHLPRVIGGLLWYLLLLKHLILFFLEVVVRVSVS